MANAPQRSRSARQAGKAVAASSAPASSASKPSIPPPSLPAPPLSTQPPDNSAAVPRLEPLLPEGMRMGAFEIKGVIAQSRAAVIYRVADHSLGIPAAIKEYLPLGVARRGRNHHVEPIEPWHEDTIDLGRRAFFSESRALARCDDPALLRVTQLWEINGTAYRVMPLYSGKRLVDLRREMKAPIDEAGVRALMNRLLDALAAYHASAGGVHGNVTPANILMPALDRPLLLGPGKTSALLATDLGEAARSDFEAAFAAPEQLEPHATVGVSADLFGLAQTLRYCITGGPPIGHESLRAAIHRILGAGAVSAYSDALLDALTSAASPSPAERPKSVEEFRVRLRRLEAQSAALNAPAAPAAPAMLTTPTMTNVAGAAAAAVATAPVAAAPVAAAPVAAAPPAAPAAASAQEPDPEEMVDETIDVSSVFGDLPRLAPNYANAADARVEPTLDLGREPPQARSDSHGTEISDPDVTIPIPPAKQAAGNTPPNNASNNAPSNPPAHLPITALSETADDEATVIFQRPRLGDSLHFNAGTSAGMAAAPNAGISGNAGLDLSAVAQQVAHAAAHTPAYPSAQPPAEWQHAPHGPHAFDEMQAMHGNLMQSERDGLFKSLFASRSVRLGGLIVVLFALAIVVILAVSGVWDPRGPQLDLPSAAGEQHTLPSTSANDPLADPGTATPLPPSPSGSGPLKIQSLDVPAAPPAAAPSLPAQRGDKGTKKREEKHDDTTELATDPREACLGRTQFAYLRCMQTQCTRPRWASHPECVKLRHTEGGAG